MATTNEPKVAKLKHMLEVKAAELAGTDMVMVHDLLVLTNDFLSDKNRADEERSKGGGDGGGESLFQKMLTEEQRQRDKRVRGIVYICTCLHAAIHPAQVAQWRSRVSRKLAVAPLKLVRVETVLGGRIRMSRKGCAISGQLAEGMYHISRDI